MSDHIKARFEQATRDVKDLSERPDSGTLLDLYAYYKQATEGDVSGKRPGMMDFAGRAKYESWANLKQMPAETAMERYIDIVDELKTA